MVAFKLLFRARDCWTHAALKLQSEHCNVAKGPNFNFQFVVPCLVLILSELRALSLSPNLNLQFEKACITLRSSSILCEVWERRSWRGSTRRELHENMVRHENVVALSGRPSARTS